MYYRGDGKMGEVRVRWINDDEGIYKNAKIDIERRIVAVYQRDRTLVIPFENLRMIETKEGEEDEIESYY